MATTEQTVAGADSGKKEETNMENANGSIKAEVIKAVRENPDLTYAQIAELLGVKPHQVGIWANQDGVVRRRRKPANSLAQDDGLDGKIRQLEQQLSEARRLKAATEIRFEREGNKVAVYGLGAQPLVAEYKDWLRFLRKNGASRLREFIEAEFASAKGNGNGTIQ
jgi:DNA-binding transcriptional regulator YiaG